MAEEQSFHFYAFVVADGLEYETEYDGRMFTCCSFCHVDLSVRDHASDCLTLRARKELGCIWLRHKERQELKDREANRFKVNHDAVRIPCDVCGKHVAYHAIVEHMNGSFNCKRLKKAITKKILETKN